MTRATITSVKREARRVFGKPSTVDLDAPFGMETTWLLTLTVGESFEIRVPALTKQGALQDAFELLSTLQRKSAP